MTQRIETQTSRRFSVMKLTSDAIVAKRAMLRKALKGLQSHPGCVGFNYNGQVKNKA